VTATDMQPLPSARTLLVSAGVIGVVAGVLVLAWPGATILVLALLLGINLILTGLVSTISAVTDDFTVGERILAALFGLVSVLAGVVVVARPVRSAVVVAAVVGAFWIVGGVADVARGVAGLTYSRALTLLSGLISLAAGITVLAWPGPSVLVLVWISGLWMIAFGALRITLGFTLPAVAKV
jgi:uncharacterized membrane protein HdeD (DUF308 family)